MQVIGSLRLKQARNQSSALSASDEIDHASVWFPSAPAPASSLPALSQVPADASLKCHYEDVTATVEGEGRNLVRNQGRLAGQVRERCGLKPVAKKGG